MGGFGQIALLLQAETGAIWPQGLSEWLSMTKKVFRRQKLEHLYRFTKFGVLYHIDGPGDYGSRISLEYKG